MFRLTSQRYSFFAVAILAATLAVDASAQTAKTKKPQPKPRRSAVVGPAIGGNKATPIDRIKAAKGFQV